MSRFWNSNLPMFYIMVIIWIPVLGLGLPVPIWLAGLAAILAGALITNCPMPVSRDRPGVDTPQPSAGGLTLRELRADIAATGREVDPTMSAAHLLAYRNLLRGRPACVGP